MANSITFEAFLYNINKNSTQLTLKGIHKQNVFLKIQTFFLFVILKLLSKFSEKRKSETKRMNDSMLILLIFLT